MKLSIVCTQLTILSVSGVMLPAAQALPSTTAATAAIVAGHQAHATEAMQVSIDKQKAAVRLQVGDGGPAAPFFTTPWVAPQVFPPAASCDAMAESDLASLVKEVALEQDLSPLLIRAVIRRESASFSCAVSEKGAVGLMQLMPDTAQRFGADPFDPRQNVQAGSKYLKQLLTRYKSDTKLALAAYNAGPERVDAAGGVPTIPETTAYVAAVLKEIASATDSVSAGPKPE